MHFVAEMKPNELCHILNSEKCTKDLLHSINVNGTDGFSNDNILMTILKLNMSDLNTIIANANLVINHKYCTEELINYKNNKNETPFMIGIEKSFEVAEIIKNSGKFKNDNNINAEDCLQYLKAAITSSNISGVKVITSLPGFDNGALLIEDENKDTCYHYAAKSNLDIFKYLMEMEGFDKSVLSKVNSMEQTCFSISVEESSDISMHLLDEKLVDYNMLSHPNYDGYNSLQITCFLQKEDVLQKIISHPDMSSEILSHKTILGYNIFGYNELSDKIVEILMKSAYFNISMLKELKNIKFVNIFGENTDVPFTIPIYMEMVYSGRIVPIKKMLEFVEDECIFEQTDSLQNNMLLASSNNKELCNIILSHEHMSSKSVMQENAREENIMMLLIAQNDDENVEKLLSLQVFNPGLITKIQSNSHTVLNYIKNNNSSFQYIVNSGHLTKEFIETYVDEDENNFVMSLIKKNYPYVDNFLHSDLIDAKSFMHKNSLQLTLSSYLMQYDQDNGTTLLETVVNLDCYSDTIINQIISKDSLPLLYFTLPHPYQFKLLMESKYDLTPSFDHLYDNNHMNTVLRYLSKSNFDGFKLYVQSKYFKMDHFLAPDEYKHSIVTSFCLLEENNLQWIVDNPVLWTDRVKYYGDIDNDNLLMFISSVFDRFKFLLNNNYVDIKMIELTNNYGLNIFGYLAEHDKVPEFKLLNEKFSMKKYLSIKNKRGYNLLHMMHSKSSELLDYVYSQGYFTSELLNSSDRLGKTLFMKLIESHPKLAEAVISDNLCTSDVFNKLDNDGQTSLMYSCRYNPHLIKIMVNHENFDKALINFRSYSDDYSCIDYGAVYNANSVTELLTLDECNPDLLHRGHMDYGSTLLLAARYQPEALKAILNWDKMTWKLLMTINNYLTFLQIGAIYNPLSLKYAIDSHWDLTQLFLTTYATKDLDHNASVPILAAKFQPIALKYILDSKYCTPDVMSISSAEKKLCHHYALECQPLALYHLINSENNMIKELLEIPYDTGYKILNVIKIGNNGIVSLSDAVAKIPLLTTENERCADTDKNACSICYGYKSNVCFTPCMHMTCAACAIKVKKCPACRVPISNKNLLH